MSPHVVGGLTARFWVNATAGQVFRKEAKAGLIMRAASRYHAPGVDGVARYRRGMTIAADATVLPLGDAAPHIPSTAFVAPGARLIGDVTLGEESSVWYNAVLRGDSAPIVIGAGSNLQDNVTVHVDAGSGVTLGEGVSVGHNAVVHGCTVGDGSLIGMGSVILSGARIGAGCLVAGGAVVLGGTEVPDGSLVAGIPAKVRRALTDEEKEGLRRNAEVYLAHTLRHREAVQATEA